MFKKTPQLRVLLGYCRRRAASVVFGVFLFSLILASVITLLRPIATEAASNNYLNFQARLQTAAGAIVPDGYYNVQFRLYDTSSGGSALWTESWYDSNGVTAGNDNRLQVKNGYFSANLGAQTAFTTNINWEQELWLTMRVGGSAQSASPSYDTEMNPRLKVTGVPYAFRASELAKYNAATGYTGLLQFQNTTGGNQTFLLPDQGAAGTYTLMTEESLAGLAIQNGTGVQSGNMALQSTADSSVTALLKARSGQTADVLRLTDSSDSILFNVSSTGNVGITNNATISGIVGVGVSAASGQQLRIQTGSASTVGLSITGSASQTADLIQLRDSGNNVVARFTAAGSLQTSALDTVTAGTLALGGSNATAVAINENTTISGSLTQTGGSISLTGSGAASTITTTSTSLNITAGASSTWQTDTGTLTINAGGNALSLGTGGSGTLALGSSNTTTINLGALSNNARTINIGLGTGGSQAQTVNIGSQGGASATAIQSGTAGISLTSTGGMTLRSATSTLFKPTADTTTAFQIQPSSSTTPVFNVDTTNSRIGIGKNNPAYTLDVVGDLNLSSGSQFRINGVDICDNSGCAPASDSTNYVHNNASNMVTGQNGNLYITSKGNYATARFQQKLFGTGDIIQAANGVGMINMSVDYHGWAFFKPTDTGTSTFLIQDNSGNDLFSADSTNDRLYVGSSTADNTGVTLVLDTKNNAGDPTGVNGAMYYNANMGRFRCYESGSWKNCLSRNDYTPAFIGYNQDPISAVGVGATPAASGTANYANLVSVTVPVPTTVSGIRVSLGTYSGTAGNVDVGLYNNSGTRLAASGSVAAPASGSVTTVNFTSSATIEPGIYWLAIASNQSGNDDGTGGPIFKRYGSDGVGGNLAFASSFPLPSSVTLGSPSGTGIPFALMGIVSGGVTQ